MYNDILVSVIIPTYKRANTLRNSIESVLSQTHKNIEVIVVDDNNSESTDRLETEKIMIGYRNTPNVKYIKHKKNMNGSAARNTGIKKAMGKYIAFLDDDDEFLPDKIELQVKKLESLDTSWGICYTQFVRKKNGKIIDRGIENIEGYVADEILKGSIYISAGSNVMIRKDVVEKINGFNEAFLRRQDLEFLIRASSISKIAHVPEVCLVINKDDRSNTLSEKQLIKNTDEFLEGFSNHIDKLSTEERKKVIIGQKLIVVRYYLLKFKFRKAYEICRENKITIKMLVKYMFYLLRRRTLKLCYGFKI